MRHIVVVGAVLIGCGRRILDGFNRLVSMMCFLVERSSQTGSELALSSSSASSETSRDFFSVFSGLDEARM